MDRSGILLRVGATLFFTIMVLFVKMLAGTVPLGQIIFFRSAVALIPLVLFLVWTREFPKGLATKRPGAHVLRCALGCAAMFASFASLAYLPMAHASIIGYLAPIMAVVLAWALLGEEVNRIRWISVALGFLGMLVLVVPELSATEIDKTYLTGVVLALVMAFLTAGAKIQIRHLALTENAGAIAFYFALTCALVGLATAVNGWLTPSAEQLVYLVGAGLAGGVAHIMMTLALQQSEVSKLAPFEYLSLVFAVLADAAVFHIVPGWSFYGATIIIFVAMWLIAFKDNLAHFVARTSRTKPLTPHQQILANSDEPK